MRGLTLTLTHIVLALVILLTSPFPTQAQSRVRTITIAQVEEIVKNFKIRPGLPRETPEGHKLERLVNCTQDKETNRWCEGVAMPPIINELLLRRQIRDMGEACTSDGIHSTVLYSTPLRLDRSYPVSTAYQVWQNELLDTGLTFCNPFKGLACSSNSKKCECRPGTVWKPEEDQEKCSAILGGYCWIPGVKPPEVNESVSLYDPLSLNFRGMERIVPSQCERMGVNASCELNLKLFLNYTCANDEIRELDQKLEDQFKDLPRLNFGETCNLEHQTQLFTTTEAEVKDYKIRVKNLEAILAAKTPFCDLKLLLMCGSGGKCECIQPSTYDSGTKLCTFKYPHGSCQAQSALVSMTTKFSGSVAKEIMEGFKTVLVRGCPFKCDEVSYPGGGNPRPTVIFCRTCPDGETKFIGKNCDKSLTLFLEGAPPPSLPIDIPDYDKQLELFVQFNEKAKEFEKLFRLEKNSPCDFAGELEVYRSIRRIKNVELPDKIFTEQNYKDLMSSMDKLIGQLGGKAGLCRYRLRGVSEPGNSEDSDSLPLNRPRLLCGPNIANPICYEPCNTVYLHVLMKRLSGKSFQATPTGSCAPHPKDILKYAEGEFGKARTNETDPFVLVNEGYEYLFNTLENHWIDNSKFCKRTEGFKCAKSVDDRTNSAGKCEFSQAYLDEVNEEEGEKKAKLGNGSKSSLPSNQHWFPTLLFILHIIILN